MYDHLRPEQQTQLSAAILPIALGQYKTFADMSASHITTIKPRDVRTLIDGMTFEEIVALARKQPFKLSVVPSSPT